MVDKCIAKGDGICEISDMLPRSSAVTLIGKSEESAREYMRRLGRRGFIVRFACAESDDEAVSRIEIGDDVRMIISYGGERETDCAKRLAYLRKLPVYAVAASPDAVTAFASRCSLVRGGLVLSLPCASPAGASLAEDISDSGELAAAFGGVCACAAGLFDSEAYLRAVGKSFCAESREIAYGHIYSAIDAAAKYGRNSPSLVMRMGRIALELSLAASNAGLSFVRGAADDCARTMRMLCRREERPCLPRGELAFVFASTLAETYREMCETDLSLALPPDNNLRAEALSEYLGFDEIAAAKAAVRKISDVSLAAYRVREYRDELYDSVTDAVKATDDAKKTFRRLHSDDGYSLCSALEPSEVKLCIALSPDTFAAAGSALVLMRDFGLLDRYLF